MPANAARPYAIGYKAVNAQIHKDVSVSDNFMFATGIECSYPQVDNGVRRDLLEECGHYENLGTDLQLTADLGLKYLRYGLPLYRTFLGPGKYDWEFADQAMNEMRRLGITPILDLMHFGVPDWIGNFQNPDLPRHFAQYAAAVATRYPWVTHFTPVNEMYVTARLSGKDGAWNEQLTSDRGFVTALKHVVKASIMAATCIAEVRASQGLPEPFIIPSESAEYKYEAKRTPSYEVQMFNQTRLLSLDLIYKHPVSREMKTYLADNGMTRDELQWLMHSPRAGKEILGIDYYGWNEHLISSTGRNVNGNDFVGLSQMYGTGVAGLSQICGQYYQRYKRPIMITETNWFNAEGSADWLWKMWANVQILRDLKVPVVGFTWYSLTNQRGWETCLRGDRPGKIAGCGLYDLGRQPNPVAHEYRALLEEFDGLKMALRPNHRLNFHRPKMNFAIETAKFG